MASKVLTYSGTELYRENSEDEYVFFGLYGNDDIDFDKTKEAIKEAFEDQHKATIIKQLEAAGLAFCGFEYYSPRAYNFSNDSLDLRVSVKDRKKLNQWITEHKDFIQKMQDQNKSYDGYMATTPDKWHEELNAEPSTIVLYCVLNDGETVYNFDICDHFVFEEEDDSQC